MSERAAKDVIKKIARRERKAKVRLGRKWKKLY